MTRVFLFFILITFASKGVGFLRDLLLAYHFGTSALNDIYNIAIMLPVLIFGSFASAAGGGIIPIATKLSKDRLNSLFSGLIVFYFIIGSLVLSLAWIFCSEILELVVGSESALSLDKAISFSRIALYSIPLMGPVYIFMAYVQFKGAHLVNASLGFALNLGLILGILAASVASAIFLPIGYVASFFFQLLLLLYYVRKNEFFFELDLQTMRTNIKKVLSVSFPIFLILTLNQLNVLADKMIASRLEVGSISALSYADRLVTLVSGLLIIPLISICYPKIASAAVDSRPTRLAKLLFSVVAFLFIMVLPASTFIILNSEFIVELLFERGAFDDKSVLLTSSTLTFYMVGILGLGLKDIFSRFFFAIEKTYVFLFFTLIGLFFNVALSLILADYFGVSGLALATSISFLTISVAMGIYLKNRLGNSVSYRSISMDLLKVCVINSFIFGCGIVIEEFFVAPLYHFVLSLLIYMIVYPLLLFVSKISIAQPQIELFLDKANRFLHR